MFGVWCLLFSVSGGADIDAVGPNTIIGVMNLPSTLNPSPIYTFSSAIPLGLRVDSSSVFPLDLSNPVLSKPGQTRGRFTSSSIPPGGQPGPPWK